jgi:hypothetical protein
MLDLLARRGDSFVRRRLRRRAFEQHLQFVATRAQFHDAVGDGVKTLAARGLGHGAPLEAGEVPLSRVARP